MLPVLLCTGVSRTTVLDTGSHSRLARHLAVVMAANKQRIYIECCTVTGADYIYSTVIKPPSPNIHENVMCIRS